MTLISCSTKVSRNRQEPLFFPVVRACAGAGKVELLTLDRYDEGRRHEAEGRGRTRSTRRLSVVGSP